MSAQSEDIGGTVVAISFFGGILIYNSWYDITRAVPNIVSISLWSLAAIALVALVFLLLLIFSNLFGTKQRPTGVALFIVAVLLVAMVTAFYFLRDYVSGLTGTPWWLIPLAGLITIVLAFGCLLLGLCRRAPRNPLQPHCYPLILDNFLLKSLSLTALLCGGVFLVWSIEESPALSRYESPESIAAYRAELEQQAELEAERRSQAEQLERQRSKSEQAAKNEQARQSAREQSQPLLDTLLDEYQGRRSAPYYEAAIKLLNQQEPKDSSTLLDLRRELESTRERYANAVQMAASNYDRGSNRLFYEVCAHAALEFESPEKALDHLTLLAATLPAEKSWAAYRKSVIYFSALDDPAQALSAIDLALAEKPENPRYHSLRGMYLWKLGQLKDSASEFHKGGDVENEEILHFLSKNARAVFTLAVQQIDSAAIDRHDFVRLWFYAVCEPKQRQMLQQIESQHSLGVTSQDEPNEKEALQAIMEPMRPQITQCGLLPDMTGTHDAYSNFCQENNFTPGIAELIWAAALAAAGDYDTATVFARGAVAQLKTDDAKQMARRHMALYKQQQPLRTREHIKILFEYGSRVQLPNVHIPPLRKQ